MSSLIVTPDRPARWVQGLTAARMTNLVEVRAGATGAGILQHLPDLCHIARLERANITPLGLPNVAPLGQSDYTARQLV